jgi:transcriptional regulator with PAS, ATPase and Fis domain
MLYLLYLRSGYIKKFPLTKKTITIGRSSKNDLCINESFVSLEHAKLDVNQNHIIIEDLGSTNGIFIETIKIEKAKLEVNQSFRIGYLSFFLKEGVVKDFDISKKVQPALNKISKMMSSQAGETQKAINLLYTEPLIEVLQIGFQLDELIDIFKMAKNVLDQVLEEGCLILITRENNNNIIESKWNFHQKYNPYIFEILQNDDIFEKTHINEKMDSYYFSSFPFLSGTRNLLLIYILKTEKPIHPKITEFLKDLSVEVSIIDALIEQNKSSLEKDDKDTPEIITKNQILLNFLSKCRKIASSDLYVMIEGETGTGKELIAKFIHSKSKRKSGNFVAVNCAAIPETLMEDELFGHEKGAFTDAKDRRKGKLEASSGGTLVLDEIGDMPQSLQKKLLRAIQEGEFYRIGGNKPIKVDLRIICLTHTNIIELLEKGIFREDLYYRLNHVTLKILPLRERKEDIIPLISHFVKIYSKKNQISIKGFTRDAIAAMEMYDWPGNIRELQNEINKVLSLADEGDVIDLTLLKDPIIDVFHTNKSQLVKKKKTEKETILELLKTHKWNKTIVAKKMNISRTALYEKIKKYQIK